MTSYSLIAIIIGNPRSTNIWTQAIATEAQQAMLFYKIPIIDKPVKMEASFYLPKPPSGAKQKYHINQPDLIHIPKVLEALRGIMITKEAIVQELTVRKFYSINDRPKVCINMEVIR